MEMEKEMEIDMGMEKDVEIEMGMKKEIDVDHNQEEAEDRERCWYMYNEVDSRKKTNLMVYHPLAYSKNPMNTTSSLLH